MYGLLYFVILVYIQRPHHLAFVSLLWIFEDFICRVPSVFSAFSSSASVFGINSQQFLFLMSSVISSILLHVVLPIVFPRTRICVAMIGALSSVILITRTFPSQSLASLTSVILSTPVYLSNIFISDLILQSFSTCHVEYPHLSCLQSVDILDFHSPAFCSTHNAVFTKSATNSPSFIVYLASCFPGYSIKLNVFPSNFNRWKVDAVLV